MHKKEWHSGKCRHAIAKNNFRFYPSPYGRNDQLIALLPSLSASQLQRALIAGLAAACTAVFDRAGGAAANAGHAMRAARTPDRAPGLHPDRTQGANPLAFATGNTGVASRERPRFYLKTVKSPVDQA